MSSGTGGPASSEDGGGGGGGGGGAGSGNGAQTETSTSSSTTTTGGATHYLMWMTRDEVSACCPHLMTSTEEKEKSDNGSASSSSSSSEILDSEEMNEMEGDVHSLVKRARRQIDKGAQSVNVSHTLNVLSAYARIGALAGIFRESGALNLIMELLWSKVASVRQSAGFMLKALATHDAGSRAYVLLSLANVGNDESLADPTSRTMLMELFAETASKEEHGVSFDSVCLPQVKTSTPACL